MERPQRDVVMSFATNAKIVSILTGFGLCSVALAENPIFQTYYSPDPAPVVFGDTVCVYTGNDEGGGFFTMNGWRDHTQPLNPVDVSLDGYLSHTL